MRTALIAAAKSLVASGGLIVDCKRSESEAEESIGVIMSVGPPTVPYSMGNNLTPWEIFERFHEKFRKTSRNGCSELARCCIHYYSPPSPADFEGAVKTSPPQCFGNAGSASSTDIPHRGNRPTS